jgi:hypothetical protein
MLGPACVVWHVALPGAKLKRVCVEGWVRVSVDRSYLDFQFSWCIYYFFSTIHCVPPKNKTATYTPILHALLHSSLAKVSLSSSDSRFNIFLLVIASNSAIADFSYYLTYYILPQ